MTLATLLVTVPLLGLWLLLTGTPTAGQLAVGVPLSTLAAGLAVRRMRERLGPQLRKPKPAGALARTASPLRRLRALLLWLLRLVVDIVVANFRIAALVLDLRRRPQPMLVELPLALESELGIYLLACTISLTPGTLTLDLVANEGRRPQRLLIHAIDLSELHTGGRPAAPDPDAWAAAVKARYEAPLLELFQ
jgi:multicomponent K+:H+ antiporter subunit E